MKAYDLLVQAESGLAQITGHPRRTPVASACRSVTSPAACRPTPPVLESLIGRGITGQGARLEVSLFDGMADWMNVPLLYTEGTGHAPERVGLAHPSICPYGAFETSDGALMLISIQNEREWARFCAVFMAEPDLPQRPGYTTNTIRVANRPTVDAHVAAVFRTLTREAAAARLRDAGTAFGMVNGVADLVHHPALRRVTTRHGERPGLHRRPTGHPRPHRPATRPRPRHRRTHRRIRHEFAPALQGATTDRP